MTDDRRGAGGAGLALGSAALLGPGALLGAGALLCIVLSLALFWPGIALYDSVDQYSQALSGDYADWHPPAMAHLWALFAGWWPGGAPMLVLQLGLYWLGLGLLASASARRGAAAAGWSVLGIGAFLLTSCWMGAILKDSQMVGALAAATGIVGWFRIGERPLPWWAAAFALLLLAYACLVRANAVFAVVPLGLALFRWGGLAGWKIRAAAAVALTAAAILVAPLVNHRLLGAEPSGVEKSILLYDIGGAQAWSAALLGTPDPAWQARGYHHCYSPLEWDGLGMSGCSTAPLLDRPAQELALLWLATLIRHPIAYAMHRLGHFDTTMRLVVPAGLPHAVAPADPEPNDLGLGAQPGAALRAVFALGRLIAALPIGWPACWLALDLVALQAARKAAPGPYRELALALALSALTMGASFLAISVASDLRYHLWTMIAAMLAFALLAAGGAIRRRHLVAAAAVLVAVTLAGAAGRLLLAPIA